MFTLRFESDSRGTSPDTTLVMETKEFRTQQKQDGTLDVLIPNEHGVEIYYPLGFDVGGFDRCYVMNSAGATVARYVPTHSTGPSRDAALRERDAA